MWMVSHVATNDRHIHAVEGTDTSVTKRSSLRSGCKGTVSVCCPSDHDGPRGVVNRALRAGAFRKNFDRPAAQEPPAQTCFLLAPVNPVDETSQSVRQSTACQQAKTTMRGA
ncbi:hypothetical protein D6T63_15985 [Arthrobacter cheniae]|uniref:Uncharacterized protein n=1 Tax=Arthrobacter cheniae TaxID=1258888 RepID=A0A3A5M0E1_9MICC|nr:hypothetical protein D6T63_15985 [Arthrobacter cheniae]